MIGKRAYLDLEGDIPNKKILDSGKKMGRTQSEYNEVTHFNIKRKNKMKYISVPTNQEAMARLDLDQCIMGDLIEFTLNKVDYAALWSTGVIDEINEKLNVSIDDYEDERITGIEKLTEAKRIVESKKALNKSNDIIIDNLLLQINSAIENNTGVFFFF
ncbi:hypothetical protein [Serratia microhaemolytica]|uniref:hypothetical protein n=1 Tax=Serratia microhaemolytica TaxID=2675110 RepID=UPI000FDE9B54|nr:hypothetical protein [Serratia microhaemolytica]